MYKTEFSAKKTIHMRLDRRRKKNVPQFLHKIHFQGVDIEPKEQHEVLGVQFQNDLNFKEHQKIVVKKAKKRAGVCKLIMGKKKNLSRHARKILCSSMVHPVMDTFAEVWHNDRSATLNELNVIQTDLIKYVVGARANTPKISLNADLGWLSPKLRRVKKILSVHLKIKNLRQDHSLKTRKKEFEEFCEAKMNSKHLNK